VTPSGHISRPPRLVDLTVQGRDETIPDR
jgi:hypothetical protein